MDAFERTEAEIRYSAYYEAGHVVLGSLLFPDSVSFSTIRSVGDHPFGMTQLSKCRNNSDNYLTVLFGGMAATDLFLHHTDIGNMGDLDEIYKKIEENAQLAGQFGFFACHISEYGRSRQVMDRLDTIIQVKMDELFTQARHLIADNMNLVGAIAEALFKEETLTASRIMEITDQCRDSND